MVEYNNSLKTSNDKCELHNEPKICRISLTDIEINLCKECAMEYFNSENFASLKKK